ncbi:MAG: zinc ABC transporter substrate-binding protein [Helicobacteraceae bacterium]|jgi:zinc transport system substrate-binding protein|nr:zinc ABC transporter substrate-binding protein [Helicobacteraceae bacterium]
MIRSIFFLLALSFSFAQAKLVVAVSVPPQAWLVKQIAGDLVDVIVIAPKNAGALTYEPKQAQIASLTKADIYLSCGVDFEKTWLDRFKSAAPQLKVYATDGGFVRLKTNGADDTRVWLSATAMRVQAQAIVRALSESDPSNMGKYQINGMKLFQTIDRVKAQIASLLAPYYNKAFLVYSPALGYIANDYRLRQIAVEFRGEPKPAEISELKNVVETEKITVLFVPDGISAKAAQTVSQNLKLSVVTVGIVEDDWEAMMHAIAVNLITAFN